MEAEVAAVTPLAAVPRMRQHPVLRPRLRMLQLHPMLRPRTPRMRKAIRARRTFTTMEHGWATTAAETTRTIIWIIRLSTVTFREASAATTGFGSPEGAPGASVLAG